LVGKPKGKIPLERARHRWEAKKGKDAPLLCTKVYYAKISNSTNSSSALRRGGGQFHNPEVCPRGEDSGIQ
jgi:hypothetical protein